MTVRIPDIVHKVPVIRESWRLKLILNSVVYWVLISWVRLGPYPSTPVMMIMSRGDEEGCVAAVTAGLRQHTKPGEKQSR